MLSKPSKQQVMKKISIITVACAFLFANASAQGIPAPTTIKKKKVLLELYSGIHCQFCPTGDRVAKELAEANPGKVIIFDIQAGIYAAPYPGEPDYRTPFGDGLEALIDLTGYPAGVVNRHIFAGWGQAPNGLAMPTNRFAAAASQIMSQDASANIGVEAEIDVQTRLLTVNVQVYYTGNPSTTTNKLSVAILQDNLIGPQIIGSGVTPDPDLVLPNGLYNHSHMLRHLLTTTFGQNISPAIAGSTIDKTYSYLIRDSIYEIPAVLGDLKIVVFLAENTKEIINAEVVKPVFTNFQYTLDTKAVDAGISEEPVCGGYSSTPFVKFMNNGSQTVTSLAVDYTINGSINKTYQWTGNVAPFSEAQIDLTPINYYPLETNTLSVTIKNPNGSADQNSSNDGYDYEFESAPDASNTVIMKLQLDRYGAEVSWKLQNSGGAELYSGGPYANVSSTSPLPAPIRDTFSLTSADCYELVVIDTFGDGILGTNVGFTLTDNEGLVIVSNYANYEYEGRVSFGVDAPKVDSSDVFTAVGDANALEGIRVYPNPASDVINIILPSENISNLNIHLSNFLGQTVMTLAENEQQRSGNFQVNTAGLPPGIYFLQFAAGENRHAQKIVIAN